ncbi:MAG: phosphoribosyltransferase [Micromonosporaceae bacterium]
MYDDRAQAGRALAEYLAVYQGSDTAIVLGLVRGGVPVAAAAARQLGVRLDALVVRKLGVPWAPEVAFGAVGPGGVRVLNPGLANRLTEKDIHFLTEREAAEVARRERLYRRDRPPLDLSGATAIVMDDGLATGATARAAVEVARVFRAHEVIVVAPVGSRDAVDLLRQSADQVICPVVPEDFGAVSRYYRDFHQVTDDEVIALLA